MNQLNGNGGGACDGEAQAGKVELVALGVCEDRLIEGGGTGKNADPVLANAAKDFRNVKHQLGEGGGAADQAGKPACLVSKRMEEGVHDEVAIAFCQTNDLGPGFEGSQVLAVAGHDPLGLSGGS